MNWFEKSIDIREEQKPGSEARIVFECKLQPIPSDTPINKIGTDDKVRITTSEVVRMITAETNFKIGNLIEEPHGGEVRNYFFDDMGDELIVECWIFEKQEEPQPEPPPAPKPVLKVKKTKKTLAKKNSK